jgi:uncharacterized membrane protein
LAAWRRRNISSTASGAIAFGFPRATFAAPGDAFFGAVRTRFARTLDFDALASFAAPTAPAADSTGADNPFTRRLDGDFSTLFLEGLAGVMFRVLNFGPGEARTGSLHMDDNSSEAQEPSNFRAVLAPHRSLPPSGFLALMIGVGIVSFIAGVAFWLMGAWPVVGFFGLDALLIYGAFRLNYRSGRLRETVELLPDALTVTRFHPSGRREEFTFNPYWVRVELTESRDGRTDLRLRLHDRVVSFGRFLTDDERRDLAGTLSGALTASRRSFRG